MTVMLSDAVPFACRQWLLALCLSLLLAGCGEAPPDTVRLTGATMGTRYHVTWLAGQDQPAPEAVHSGIEAVLEQVNLSMSTWREDSEISRFNRGPAGEWFAVSQDFADVFAMARQVSQASGGAYDVTVAPLVNLWGFGPRMGDSVPDAAAIAEARARVGEARLEFDPQRPALRKPAPMSVDFSSIAKGYGVDRVAEWLESNGIQHYLVEIGGEIRVAGDSPRGEPWRIAVEKPDPQAPIGADRAVQETLLLTDAALATSGDYRNYFEVDGVRYSHTIDPRTGAPVRHELVSVTVIHPSATMADAWATALTVLGPEEAMALATREQLAVYLVQREGDGFRSVASPAMAPLVGL
ncbi:MAG: FAD:protein FMN transferase [Halieaceae bacterium]|nr:FAD:protein FMN transferase [Halieaceae bacterium]